MEERISAYLNKIIDPKWRKTQAVWMGSFLPIEFIERHLKFFTPENEEHAWNHISSNPTITIEFIRKYEKKLNFYCLIKNPAYTLDMMEEFQRKYPTQTGTGCWTHNWNEWTSRPELTLEYVRAHPTYNWDRTVLINRFLLADVLPPPEYENNWKETPTKKEVEKPWYMKFPNEKTKAYILSGEESPKPLGAESPKLS